MAWFHVISIYLISDGDYPCEHYFLWRLSLCALLLCSKTHYDITMGDDVVRDAHCNITMGKDNARDIHCDVIMSNDIAMNLFYDVVLYLLMILLFHQ